MHAGRGAPLQGLDEVAGVVRPGRHATCEESHLVGPNAVGLRLAPISGVGADATVGDDELRLGERRVQDRGRGDGVGDDAHGALGIGAAVHEEDRAPRRLHLPRGDGPRLLEALRDVRAELQQPVVAAAVELHGAGLRRELLLQVRVPVRCRRGRALAAEGEVVGEALQQLRDAQLHGAQEAPGALADLTADLGHQQRLLGCDEEKPRDLLQRVLQRRHLGELPHHLQRLPTRQALQHRVAAATRSCRRVSTRA
mmetsp:Transcript_38736/g.109837  ORF Transcript_38736/g.109837 Transcript_38736/m.109837 type:complete len:254 (-) Transcript_38736:388-1149(-)